MLVEGVRAVDNSLNGYYNTEALYATRSYADLQSHRRSAVQIADVESNATQQNLQSGTEEEQQKKLFTNSRDRGEFRYKGILPNLDAAIHEYREENGWTIPKKVKDEPKTPLEKALDRAKQTIGEAISGADKESGETEAAAETGAQSEGTELSDDRVKTNVIPEDAWHPQEAESLKTDSSATVKAYGPSVRERGTWVDYSA